MFKKSRIVYLLVAIMLVSVAVVGCAPEDEPAAEPDDPGEELVRLNFPTATTTGTIYPLGAGMANVWNEQIDYVRVTAQASDGGIDNLNLLKDGEGHISFANTNIIVDMMEGNPPFEDRQYDGIKIVAGLYMNPNQFVLREGSGAESIADLEGRDFAPGAPGSTPFQEAEIILPEYGIDFPDGIEVHAVGFTEAIDLMRDNVIDGALIMAGTPAAAVTEMTSTADGKLVSIEEDARESLMEQYPWYGEYTIPAGTYDNQPEDVHTLGVRITLMADERVDDDVIYELTKVFWENQDVLADAHPVVERIDIENATEDLAGVPIHPGAERYYQEQGLLD